MIKKISKNVDNLFNIRIYYWYCKHDCTCRKCVRETEPNNTMETAGTIMANHETAAQAVSGSRPSQHVVTGSTSNTDEDWFKVYLSAGTQYVTCNDDPLNLRFMIQTAVLF